MEPYKSNLPEEERVSMRVASSPGNPSLTLSDNQEIGGRVLRGGAVILSTQRPEFFFFPKGNATSTDLWSDDFHVYELIWKKNELVMKVDGNVYASTSDESRLFELNHPVNFIYLFIIIAFMRRSSV